MKRVVADINEGSRVSPMARLQAACIPVMDMLCVGQVASVLYHRIVHADPFTREQLDEAISELAGSPERKVQSVVATLIELRHSLFPIPTRFERHDVVGDE